MWGGGGGGVQGRGGRGMCGRGYEPLKSPGRVCGGVVSVCGGEGGVCNGMKRPSCVWEGGCLVGGPPHAHLRHQLVSALADGQALPLRLDLLEQPLVLRFGRVLVL